MENKLVLDYLRKTAMFREILEGVKKDYRTEIDGSGYEMVLLSTLLMHEGLDKDIVVVNQNTYNAQKVYDTLSRIIPNTFFYPKDDFVSTELLAESFEFKKERINTINNILFNKERKIIVTNAIGVLQKIVTKGEYLEHIICFSKGKKYSLKEMNFLLASSGYQKTYTVEKVGDFSSRGGILDVFPIGSDVPYRLDFFGNTLDEIKVFDIDTQRSIKNVEEITVLPVYEYFLNDENKKKVTEYIENELKNDLPVGTRDKYLEDLELIENNAELDRLSKYLNLYLTSNSSIVDYLEDKIIVYFDYAKIKTQVEFIYSGILNYFSMYPTYFRGIEMLNNLDLIDGDKIVYVNKDKQIPSLFKHHYLTRGAFIYDNNVSLFMSDLKRYKNTTVLAVNNEDSLVYFKELLTENGISLNLIEGSLEIKKGIINLTVDPNLFGFELEEAKIVFFTESDIFRKPNIKKIKYNNDVETKRIKSINELKKGDYVVHVDYGIGQFIEVKTLELGKSVNDYIFIKYAGDDSLYVPIDKIDLITKYAGSESFKPKLSKLNSGEWKKTKKKAQERAADLADKLINLYTAREEAEGFQYNEDNELQTEFEKGFEYVETKDQTEAIAAVKKDMESKIPMDRLICGDVGFGKTEVALRAAFKAVCSNKQVAYLAPTTILSRQHYFTFKERMEKFGVVVELLNRFQSPQKVKDILQKTEDGFVDVLIGTHRILSNDVHFKDLGLLIIDEEQRFGVLHKERIKEIKINVDVITLTATPIPRTLQMAMMGVKNMSLLETPPDNRYPIQTYVIERNDYVIKDAIERELARNGQVFYLYNRVSEINTVKNHIQKLVKDARIAIIHGQMDKNELEKTIRMFIDKEYDVLVSTTIIETGIDIPNANTLIIHNADLLGLSQLYQIKGRVGRSDKIAYAYFMYDKHKKLTEDAEKRLKVIKDFAELGSGFKIAVRDLSIRGAGDVLGNEQSGFIDSVGVELYLKILDEEIKKRRSEYIEKDENDNVTINISRYIDSKYIDDDYVKIEMHKKIIAVNSLQELENLRLEFIDRFGSYAKPLDDYMKEKLLENLVRNLGAEKISFTKTNATIIISEKISKTLSGEFLFKEANKVSRFIRFMYKLNKIYIILDIIKNEDDYIDILNAYLDVIVNSSEEKKIKNTN